MLPDPSTATDPVDEARVRNERRQAMSWIVRQVRAFPRIEPNITEHYDWERCRINVYHLVAPELVRWS